MDFRQVQENAQSECGFSQDTGVINIYLGALASNESIAEISFLIREKISRHGLPVNVFTVGSSGYYDLEPVLLVEKPSWPVILYRNVNRKNIAELIQDVVNGNDPRPDLAFCTFGDIRIEGIPDGGDMPLFKLQNRVALRNCGHTDPLNINHYILNGVGYQGLLKCLTMSPEKVIGELRKYGIKGKGGAGFSTADKWEICRRTEVSGKYLICNAVDGDPQALTARLLMEGDPHSIIEGVLIGAYATGASQCFIVTAEEYQIAIERINTALKQARKFNLLGNKILNTDFSVEIEIKPVKRSLIAGEETALLQALEGKQAMPYLRRFYPAESGYRNKPTLINNVETLANIPVIFNGQDLSSVGRRGTKVVTLAGNIKHSYTVEVPLGTSIKSIVAEIGGGAVGGKEVLAVQAGGPTGTFFKIENPEALIDYESMKSAAAIIGSGTIEVFGNSSCAVEIARKKAAYLQTQSCGKCVFCREGSVQIAQILHDIFSNQGRPQDLALLTEIGELMKVSSICGLGKTIANPVLSCLGLFYGDFESHLKEKQCLARNIDQADQGKG